MENGQLDVQVEVHEQVARSPGVPTDPSLPKVLLPAAPSILSGAGSDFEFRQKYSTVSSGISE